MHRGQDRGTRSTRRTGPFGALQNQTGTGTESAPAARFQWSVNMSEAQTTVVLDIGKSDPGDPRRTRTPNFICVEWAWRTMAYTVRLPLQLDGVNDMEGRRFDFWFEKLKDAAVGGKYTKVTVILARQGTVKHYTGTLCKTGGMAPRLCSGNTSLFEFDLCEVTVAETIRPDPASEPRA